MSAQPAEIRGYFGATGSGKSRAMREWLRRRRPARLLIWDPEGEYGDLAAQVNGGGLVDGLVRGLRTGSFRLAYQPPAHGRLGAFDVFCRTALHAAERAGGCVVVVDELAEVTGTGKGVSGWGALVRTGRKRGVELLAASIRPAEIDKTFYSQATYLRSGRLTFGPDVDRMGALLGVEADRLRGLRDLEYVERDLRDQGATVEGVVTPAGRSSGA